MQLSLDERQPPAFHFEIGRQLAPLREQGIWIVGSGNVIDALRRIEIMGSTPVIVDWE